MTTERRLVKLERRCRFLIVLLIAVGGFICFGAAGAPSPAKSTTPDELVASKITIVDKTGRKRIILDGDVDGEACLAMIDAAGNVRVSLAATQTDAGILLLDVKRRTRVALNTDGGDNAEVRLTDTAGSHRMYLFTRATHAGITLHGAQKEPALTLVNTGTHGLVGYGNITRGEGFIMAYDHTKTSGLLKVGAQRIVAAE
jgi:hypothetical protein